MDCCLSHRELVFPLVRSSICHIECSKMWTAACYIVSWFSLVGSSICHIECSKMWTAVWCIPQQVSVVGKGPSREIIYFDLKQDLGHSPG